METSYVKLSLKEYEDMKNKIKTLTVNVAAFESAFNNGQMVYINHYGWGNQSVIINPTEEVKDLVNQRDNLKRDYKLLMEKRLPLWPFGKRTVADLF